MGFGDRPVAICRGFAGICSDERPERVRVRYNFASHSLQMTACETAAVLYRPNICEINLTYKGLTYAE